MTISANPTSVTSLFLAPVPLLSEPVAQAAVDVIDALGDRVPLGMSPIMLIADAVTAVGALLEAGVQPHQALARWTQAAQRLVDELEQAEAPVRLVVLPSAGGVIRLDDGTSGLMLRVPESDVAPWMAVAAAALIHADSAARALAIRLSGDAADALASPADLVGDLQSVFSMKRFEEIGKGPQQAHHLTARLMVAAQTIDHLQTTIRQQMAEAEQLPTQSNVALMRDMMGEAHDVRRAREAVLGAQMLDDGDRIRELTAALAYQEQETARLKAELDRVYGSRSWRVTAPLRGLGPRRGR